MCGGRERVNRCVYSAICSCMLDTRALRKKTGFGGEKAKASSVAVPIIYFAIFAQATMKVAACIHICMNMYVLFDDYFVGGCLANCHRALVCATSNEWQTSYIHI